MNSNSPNFTPIALKFVLMEFILVETVQKFSKKNQSIYDFFTFKKISYLEGSAKFQLFLGDSLSASKSYVKKYESGES